MLEDRQSPLLIEHLIQVAVRITFLMPAYPWRPSGGYRVVYEYANHLSGLGHAVTVVHPRRSLNGPKVRGEAVRTRLRREAYNLMAHVAPPRIGWQHILPAVRLLFVADSTFTQIPDGDAIFATSWQTVSCLMKCPPSKGEKFYLIQGYETWMGDTRLVDATWRMPVHKIVVSKWLWTIGQELGCRHIAYIPNAVNHEIYRMLQPIETRPRQVAMVYSRVPIKGTADGIEALRIVKEQCPELRVALFGLEHLEGWVPRWMRYYRNPSQDFIVRDIYNASSIFASPSWCEGFALPPAEAACCGCSIVAADSGGIREYVEHGVTGLLSPPKNPSMLAQALCTLLRDDRSRVSLANRARAKLAEFTWDRSAAMLEKVVLQKIEAGRSLSRLACDGSIPHLSQFAG